jgi:hypothetical protein
LFYHDEVPFWFTVTKSIFSRRGMTKSHFSSLSILVYCDKVPF